MPRIEDDVKLDFKDVLIRPKRSTLKSRSVRLTIFSNSKETKMGIVVGDVFLAHDWFTNCTILINHSRYCSHINYHIVITLAQIVGIYSHPPIHNPLSFTPSCFTPASQFGKNVCL